jgi:tetratricopeptide (TPR) repeat protein
MSLRWRVAIGCLVATIVAGGAILLRLQTAGVATSPTLVNSSDPRFRSADGLVGAFVSGELEPFQHREILEGIFSSLPEDSRATWIEHIAVLLRRLDPLKHAELQRVVGHFALANGFCEEGWLILHRLWLCEGCSEFDRVDALRLLNLLTPSTGLHRSEITQSVIQKANAILSGESLDKSPLPIVWSAVQHLRASGKVQEAIDMQRLYLKRFASVLPPDELVNVTGNTALDLMALEKPDEARPLFLAVAEAQRGAVMSSSRASALSHAARSGSREQAVSLLQSALADPKEARSAASAVLYLRLLEAHQGLGNRVAAAQVADQFWLDRGENETSSSVAPAEGSSGTFADIAAAVCFSAAQLAEQRNDRAVAMLWYQRVLEAAPNTVTAQAVRDMLARR